LLFERVCASGSCVVTGSRAGNGMRQKMWLKLEKESDVGFGIPNVLEDGFDCMADIVIDPLREVVQTKR
jgi:hypothetical protein